MKMFVTIIGVLAIVIVYACCVAAGRADARMRELRLEADDDGTTQYARQYAKGLVSPPPRSSRSVARRRRYDAI